MTWRLGEQAGRIFAHVSDGIAVVDREWRFLHVNPEAARLLRRDAEALVGRVLWGEFPEAVDTQFWEVYHRALDRQEPESLEAHYGPLGGWFEVRVFPAPEGLTLYFRNVTERRAADDERRRLLRRVTGELRRSEQMLELTDALARALTLQEVADLVAKHAHSALGCLFAGVALIDEDRSVMRYVSMAPLPDDVVRKWNEFPLDIKVPATDTARRGQPLLYADQAQIIEAYPDIVADLEAAGTKAMANLPLVASGRIIGAFMATWAAPHACDEDELRFLQTLAGQAAQAIERAQLFARQRSVAATLQQAILPRQLPTEDGIELAARYEPAETGVDVGGDWYDAFMLRDGRLALTVGDVAGHGVAAAALMAQLRNAARAYAVDGHEPGPLVTKLNRLLAAASPSADALLATVVFAVLDPRSCALRWTNAGHPPPVVARPGVSARFLGAVHGPPLGVDPAGEFTQAQEQVSGEAVLLYTDGLIEQRGRSLTDGLAALLDAVVAAPEGNLERFSDEVSMRALTRAQREDDMCLLVARCTAR